jgi:hypothetical protein
MKGPLARIDSDQPLTVPILVRGTLQRTAFVVPVLLAVLFLGMALFALATGDLERAWVSLIPAALTGLGALMIGVFLIRRRCWLEVTLTGFAIRDHRGRRAFQDDEVRWFRQRWHSLSAGKWGAPPAVERWGSIMLEMAGTDGPIRYRLSYAVGRDQADPLSPLWDRLQHNLARVAWEHRDQADALVGRGWRLGGGQLWRGRDRRARDLSAITLTGVFDRHLCVWIDDDADPWLRLPVQGRNVNVLRLLLNEHVPPRPSPSEGRSLGRRLFVRRSSGWWTCACLCLLGGLPLIGLVALPLLDEDHLGTACLVAFLPGTLLLFGGLAWLQLVGRSWLAVHEHGLVGVRGRTLHRDEIGALTWGGPLVVEAWPALNLAPIVLANPPIDEDLLAARDNLSRAIAARLRDQLAQGRDVAWTHRFRFLPNGLEYHPDGGKVVVVPYADLRWALVREQDLVFPRVVFFSGNGAVPFGTEDPSVQNFYPALALLDLLRARGEPPLPAADERIQAPQREVRQPGEW